MIIDLDFSLIFPTDTVFFAKIVLISFCIKWYNKSSKQTYVS